ncbi:hypothetical protein D9615_005555 [Tricholomella constricta]|uniref:Uncharacterized protein n=1 Tax=Tricholomella constricta TaxID=117010 RepID=A0A8H5HER9_9AGAR|nr:hypothetical protein D9615_005555 [Tricholomella constricta]
MWDAEDINQLLFQLLEAVSDASGPPKKIYLRFQDAPDIDPLLPFATFLLQLSSVSLASSQAAKAVGSFLFDRLSNQDEPSLAYHLLLQVCINAEDRNPFEDGNPFEDRNPFEGVTHRPRTIVSLPDDVSQWKFSWILSCVAYEGEYWNVLIETLSQSREGIRNASILRLVYCVLGISSSGPNSQPIDQHLLSGFHLACRQGAKSTVGIVEKDPVELTLRFLLRAVGDAPSLRMAFGSADNFLVIIQPCLQSDAASAREVLQLVVGEVLDGFVESEAPKPDAERVRLCWEIYKLIRGDMHDQD